MEIGSLAEWFSGIVGALVLVYTIYQSKRSKKVRLKITFHNSLTAVEGKKEFEIPVLVTNKSPEKIAEIDKVMLFATMPSQPWKDTTGLIISSHGKMYQNEKYGASLVPGETNQFCMSRDLFLMNLDAYCEQHETDYGMLGFLIVVTERSGKSVKKKIKNFNLQWYLDAEPQNTNES
ncbi:MULTISPECIES: hypothetical protein [Lactiplantibacillus]|uniref:Uncharacterized protein n=2 Tax=Lactiplantibacillus TaxID=2767842 RepID=A0AAD0X6R0_9LACO|nr:MULTISPECIES: hypothetical protein [Lactiplantibacillus]AYJ38888.1 hypothetical protein LP667_08685 [Lactiplantibacillus paraplantarum]AYJ38942.1 hypothetical protein LP667_08980 [Lactiplantibacillus paraplantarum]KRL51344.1 hypothetical protein FD48_GL000024 [Lactiplantibacillus paraplantarum DSM 10667]MBT1137695.1 hypothetical protein [Lactiplantibacillus argentoratensis]MBT1140553.1 hypothetical protein [Lactiplantibacillus argentoratensis]